MRGAACGRLLRLPLSAPLWAYYSAAVADVPPPALFWRLEDTNALLGFLTEDYPKEFVHFTDVFLSHFSSEHRPNVPSVCKHLTTLLTTQGSPSFAVL